jgi:hypothetical protein
VPAEPDEPDRGPNAVRSVQFQLCRYGNLEVHLQPTARLQHAELELV